MSNIPLPQDEIGRGEIDCQHVQSQIIDIHFP